MKNVRLVAAIALGSASGALIGYSAFAGGDKVAYPENFDKGTLYATVDRYDNKQYRELYATPAAVEAVRNGQPIPSGTVLTLVQYKAQLDAAGEPLKDANGRFQKGDLVAYTVMEKRDGWGTEYKDDIRNGEWEYQAFGPDKKVNDKVNLTACFTCREQGPDHHLAQLGFFAAPGDDHRRQGAALVDRAERPDHQADPRRRRNLRLHLRPAPGDEGQDRGQGIEGCAKAAMADLRPPPEMAGVLLWIEPPAPMHRRRDCANLSGRTSWGEFMILQSLAGLPAFLVYFCTAIVAVVAYLFVYTRVTAHNEFDLIRANEPAAAIALGLSLLGFVLPLVSAIAHSANVWDCLIWAAIALIVQIIVYYLVRVPVPKLSERIAAGELAAAIWLGLSSLAAGAINAACMIY
jgi:uncharacterized membrane protein YjfL (UPF0719 family)